MTLDELNTIISLKPSDKLLMVGYNRRYAKLIQDIKSTFKVGPFAVQYRINAGSIPSDSWIQDLEVGGGRIIGEVCHFVDLLTYLCGSLPIKVYANVMQDVGQNHDTLNISLAYANGSIGTISYFANGHKMVPKEMIEVFANGCIAQLNDFKTLTIYNEDKRKKINLTAQDKGQQAQINQFIEAIQEGQHELIPFDEICNASVVTFKILESIKAGQALEID
jgi:predicted dehydrogenase